MNNNYTNTDREYIDSGEIFDKAVTISKNLIIIRDALSNINSYLENLNDEKVWHSPAANYLKDRYLKEKDNLEKTYNSLLDYQKYLFNVSALTDEAAKEAARIMEETEIKSLWQV